MELKYLAKVIIKSLFNSKINNKKQVKVQTTIVLEKTLKGIHKMCGSIIASFFFNQVFRPNILSVFLSFNIQKFILQKNQKKLNYSTNKVQLMKGILLYRNRLVFYDKIYFNNMAHIVIKALQLVSYMILCNLEEKTAVYDKRTNKKLLICDNTVIITNIRVN